MILLRPPWQQAGQGVDINSVASHTGRQGGGGRGGGPPLCHHSHGGPHYSPRNPTQDTTSDWPPTV